MAENQCKEGVAEFMNNTTGKVQYTINPSQGSLSGLVQQPCKNVDENYQNDARPNNPENQVRGVLNSEQNTIEQLDFTQ